MNITAFEDIFVTNKEISNEPTVRSKNDSNSLINTAAETLPSLPFRVDWTAMSLLGFASELEQIL
jgi:hypothetical protein